MQKKLCNCGHWADVKQNVTPTFEIQSVKLIQFSMSLDTTWSGGPLVNASGM